MNIARALQENGSLANEDIRSTRLRTSVAGDPVMATPVITVALGASAAFTGAFAGGFVVGHGIG